MLISDLLDDDIMLLSSSPSFAICLGRRRRERKKVRGELREIKENN